MRISINIASGTVTKEEKSPIIVGIDLGTTNSLVAYMQDGKPVAVKEANGERTLVPSVVFFNEKNEVIVGDAAKEFLISDPSRTIYSVKRLMGKSYEDMQTVAHQLGYKVIDSGDENTLVKIQVGDQFHSPISLSAHILGYLKKRIEFALNTSVEKAVITVPAYFNDAQRQATRDAGRLAGLDVLRIVNEPTAASLAYGIGLDMEEDKTIAVYDLGGGTFDVSILHIQQGIFEVLSTHGDTFLGGDDFDQAIVQYWLTEYPDLAEAMSNKSVVSEIRLQAEEAKKTLSLSEQFVGEVFGKQVSIDKTTFEVLITPFVDKTMSSIKSALKDANRSIEQIDEIIMVGGSTRVPLVKTTVAAFFGKPVNDSVHPDEVVALGAAIQADILAGNNKDVLLLDITPLSLGIETVGGLMDVIIPRNSKVPSKAGRQYTTSVDGQKNLMVAIYQGERDQVKHNRKLGSFVLKDIPPMPAGIPKIDIQFVLDADGILQVRAEELRSSTKQAIEIRPSYGITEEEMAKMLLDSIANASEDMQIRALQEAKNEAQNILLSTMKFVQQHESWLSGEEKAQLLALHSKLSKAASEEDKDVINAAMESLNLYSSPLAHKAMDIVVQGAMKGTKV